MVSPQATQNSPQSSSDSVRITAQNRRRDIITFLREELTRQQVIADEECKDLNNLRRLNLPLAQAERRASNAVGIVQYLGSTLRAMGDNRENRDFKAVAPR
jgi:hypothetical protein